MARLCVGRGVNVGGEGCVCWVLAVGVPRWRREGAWAAACGFGLGWCGIGRRDGVWPVACIRGIGCCDDLWAVRTEHEQPPMGVRVNPHTLPCGSASQIGRRAARVCLNATPARRRAEPPPLALFLPRQPRHPHVGSTTRTRAAPRPPHPPTPQLARPTASDLLQHLVRGVELCGLVTGSCLKRKFPSS